MNADLDGSVETSSTNAIVPFVGQGVFTSSAGVSINNFPSVSNTDGSELWTNTWTGATKNKMPGRLSPLSHCEHLPTYYPFPSYLPIGYLVPQVTGYFWFDLDDNIDDQFALWAGEGLPGTFPRPAAAARCC